MLRFPAGALASTGLRRAAASVLSAPQASPAAPLSRAAGVRPAAFGPSLGRGFVSSPVLCRARPLDKTDRPKRVRGPKPVYDIPVHHPPLRSPHFLSPRGVKRLSLWPPNCLMSVRVPQTSRRSRLPRRESWHRQLSHCCQRSLRRSCHGVVPPHALNVTHPAVIPASAHAVAAGSTFAAA